MAEFYQLNPRSNNHKTGHMPVSTNHSGTCPKVCPFNRANEGGCYGNSGKLGLFWWKLDRGATKNCGDINYLYNAIRNLKPTVDIWRASQAGDLPGNGTRLDHNTCVGIADANAAGDYNRGGYTYTHYSPIPVEGKVSVEDAEHNLQVIADMMSRGFMVNLSANNLEHADELADLEIAPVAVVLPMDARGPTRTPRGRTVCLCPAFIRDDMTCKRCRLCQKWHKAIVGLPAHGMSKKRAHKIAGGE